MGKGDEGKGRNVIIDGDKISAVKGFAIWNLWVLFSIHIEAESFLSKQHHIKARDQIFIRVSLLRLLKFNIFLLSHPSHSLLRTVSAFILSHNHSNQSTNEDALHAASVEKKKTSKII